MMARVLLVGLDPDTVDYSDPALPPGMNAEKVRAGIAVALKQFSERGWESDLGLIRPDETAGPTVERQLLSAHYDCVVIGAGVRLPPRHLALFEVLINAIRKTAPSAAIAFNTRPTIAPMRPLDGYAPKATQSSLAHRTAGDAWHLVGVRRE
jgi:hypothetical protein